jgi:hypothetical protein
MTEGLVEQRATTKADQWRERIGEQERSGLCARQFCKERGLAEHAFYGWRRRLRKQEPVRFALVDRTASQAGTSLELVLGGGERLRIPAGVDQATLRTVLEALRG